ncbi:MAG TPA: hypothetical protein ENI60_03875 [Candidatus Fraserbacteria bacterium]|nr:hypothetical protein [Candidatus Fraserbacteria bacterium]
MPRKMSNDFTKLSIYVPQDKRKRQPLERLHQVAKQRDRSINYLVVQAIIEFVDRQERKLTK